MLVSNEREKEEEANLVAKIHICSHYSNTKRGCVHASVTSLRFLSCYQQSHQRQTFFIVHVIPCSLWYHGLK